MKPKLPKALFVALLAACANVGYAETTTVTADGYVLAVPGVVNATSGTVDVVVNAGSSKSSLVAALGVNTGNDTNTLNFDGSVSLTLNGDYTGTGTDAGKGTSVTGVLNAGTLTGNVNILLDAKNATYGTYTSGGSSIFGAFKGSIGGAFNLTVNKGIVNHNIFGGHEVANSGDTIGSTTITINGGTIKGNVYGGGKAANGKVTNNTSVTINSLAPFSDHSADNIISAGGTGGSIGGDTTLTFNGVTGEYKGTVQGEGNATVSGTSKLSINGNSALKLNKVQDFDVIDISTGSSLTIKGAITTDTALHTVADATTIATKTDNGLGNGIITGLVSGGGSLSIGEGVTLNGKAVNGYSNGGFVVADAIYYVMGKQSPESYTGTKDANYVYVLSPDKSIKVSEVVHVGNHVFESDTNADGSLKSGPTLVDEANAALGHYVAQGGVLAITGDSQTSGMSAGAILTNTSGDGDIILRAPGYKSDPAQDAFAVHVNGSSQCNGNLYLSPKVLSSASTVDESQSMYLYLENGANISSFDSVNIGSPNAEIIINGELGSDANGNHINDYTTLGCSTTYVHINSDSNEKVVLGGTTTISNHIYYEPATYGRTNTLLYLNFNQGSTIQIEELSDGNSEENGGWPPSIVISSAYGDQFEHANEIDGKVFIDSFDFSGVIELNAINKGTLDLTLSLEKEQILKDSQLYVRKLHNNLPVNGDASITIQGQGRYILSKGNSINVSSDSGMFGLYNVGVLADDWTGTVEVNNLDATGTNPKIQGIKIGDYGNADSTIHFKGFKGYLSHDDTEIASDLVLENIVLENSSTMSAYEVTGGADIQNYTGSISGEGDFVVSSAGSHQINYSGDLSGWQGDMKVTQGSHQVNFGGDATVVNADILREGGTLAVTVGAPNAEKAVVFHGDMKVDSLTTYAGTSAEFTQDATKPQAIREIGAYQFSNHTENMKIAQGVSIAGTAISGLADVVGQISNAQIQTGAGDTYSIENVHLTNSAITAACDRVTFEDVSANGLYLAADGNGTVYESLDQQGTKFKYNAATQTVEFSSTSFSGMVLEALTDNSAVVALTVDNTVEQWQETVGDMVAHVKITLEGFSIENQTAGIVYADPSFLQIQTDGVSASGLAVSDMLAQEFDSVYYFQNGANLEIHMMLSIPEPATATMSLLALAAMAARRRRR